MKKKPAGKSLRGPLQAPGWARLGWLAHGFTTRELNLSYSRGQAPGQVTRDRRAALASLAARRRWRLVTLRQRHTDIIRLLTRGGLRGRRSLKGLSGACRERDGAWKLAGDALVTDQPGLLLAVQVADCLPILLIDPVQHVVAAVHAGWRGTLKRIAEKTVGRMRAEWGSKPRELLAVMGPGIHACCYRVGPEVAEVFSGRFSNWERFIRRSRPSPPDLLWQQRLRPAPASQPSERRRARPALTAPVEETFHLDLVRANRSQLRAAGLRASKIHALPLCTACRTDLLFSHRAEQGRAGRMMGLVGIVK
ncbi:MAG: peptidoglycan editing factor PgeF [Terriglobia bacterium]